MKAEGKRAALAITFLAIAPCIAALPSRADESSSAAIDLDPIVVVASRMPQPLSGVAAQVTVIEAADLARNAVEDLDGALRYEPGLELESAGTRFGGDSLNIRGIGGNRVQVEIDGIPLRDRFAIGAYSNGGRILVETDRIRRAEVLYGPASVLYGSNALGGVLSVTTWDPQDLLERSGRQSYFGLRGGYQGTDQSLAGSALAAWGQGSHGLLAAYTGRSGHEPDNQAPAGTPADPQDWDSRDAMLRYTWDSPGGNRLRLTADGQRRDTVTEIHSLLGYGTRFRSTTALSGDDRDQSRRLSVAWEFSAGGWQQGVLRAFDSSHETDQYSDEERAASVRPVRIERRFQYENDLQGLEGFAFRDLEWGAVRHRLGLGAEWTQNDISEVRDGLQTNLTDGSTTKTILGETLPVRDFPLSRTRETGVWLQDQVSLPGSRWELTPGLRWDGYDLDPRPDDSWREDNPDTEVVAVSESRFTPRLGVLYRAGERWTLFGQYAEGFRAPPFEDANIGFDIPLFGFRAIPNPDLRSETSQGLEFGARRLWGGSRFSLAVFHTDYDDFIESRALIGRDPVSGDLLFQSRNFGEARIYGVDLRFDQDLAEWHSGLDGWSLDLAAYWARGENRQDDVPLNSIAPPQVVAGLRRESADGAWDAGLTATFTAAKHADDIDDSGSPRFATPSWTTLDLTAGWRPLPGLELRATIFNLADRSYWRWLDVYRLDATDPMIPLLSRPGRSVSFSATLQF